MISFIQGIAQAVFVFFIVCILVVPTLMYGAELESKFLPVLSDFKFTVVDSSDPIVTRYRVDLVKLRSCDPIVTSFAWYVIDKNGIQTRVNFSAPANKDRSPEELSRPLGPNRSTIWEVSNKDVPHTSQLLIAYHQCHPLWRSKTVIPINIE